MVIECVCVCYCVWFRHHRRSRAAHLAFVCWAAFDVRLFVVRTRCLLARPLKTQNTRFGSCSTHRSRSREHTQRDNTQEEYETCATYWYIAVCRTSIHIYNCYSTKIVPSRRTKAKHKSTRRTVVVVVIVVVVVVASSVASLMVSRLMSRFVSSRCQIM